MSGSQQRRTASWPGFDDEFRALCLRTGVRASYVRAAPTEDGSVRLCSGGDAEIDGIVTNAVRARA